MLLRERNLTRAATVLGVAQPALSKTLAKLRRYFADPLFVRAGHRMEPTAKALELAGAVHSLLDDASLWWRRVIYNAKARSRGTPRASGHPPMVEG